MIFGTNLLWVTSSGFGSFFLREPFWSQKWPIFGSPQNTTIMKGKRFLSFSLMLWSILACVQQYYGSSETIEILQKSLGYSTCLILPSKRLYWETFETRRLYLQRVVIGRTCASVTILSRPNSKQNLFRTILGFKTSPNH